MAEIQHKYVSLEKATQINRRHKRDIELPGLVSIKNMFVSRSDNVPSLRPGFRYTNEIINSYADQVVSGNDIPEYVNSIAGVYGTNDLIYFTSFWPQAAAAGTSYEAEYVEGTQISEILALPISSSPYLATVTDGSPTVVVSDADFELMKKVYQGCFVKFDEDSDEYYYVVDRVLDATTFVLDDDLDTSNFGETTTGFTVYHATNPVNLGGYKYHIGQYGSETVYGAGSISGTDEHAIVGPWSSESSFYTPKFKFDVDLGDSFSTIDFSGNEYINHAYAADNFAVGENAAIYSVPRADNFWWCDDLTADGFQDSENNWFSDSTLSDCSFLAVAYNTTDNKFYSVYIDNQDPNYYWEICTWTDVAVPISNQYSKGTDAASADLHESGRVVSILYVPDVDEIWFSYEESLFGYTGAAVIKRWDCAGEAWLADLTVGSADGGYRVYGMTYDEENNKVYVMVGVSYSNGPPKQYVGYHVFNSDGTGGSGVWRDDDEDARYGATSIYDGTNSFNISTGYEQVHCGTTANSAPVIQQTDFGARSTLVPSRPILYDGDQYDETLLFVTGQTTSSIGGRIFACDVDLSASETDQVLTRGATIADLRNDQYFGAGGIGSRYSVTRPTPTLATDDYDNRYYLSVACFYDADGTTWSFHPVTIQTSLTGGDTSVVSQRFTLLSELYRSRAFSIMDGYTILFGTREYDEDSSSWTYNPRRVRWTSPGTVSDFTSPGAGFGDVKGNGQFIDARDVNGRVVTFETTSISALVPRGITADPWDYETIHDDIRILSNPVTVKDQCYFIASDGLLYSTDGINVQEVGSSLDITEFDDYTENKPIWLIFVPKMNSLAAFYPPSGTGEGPHSIFFVSLANGSVSRAEFGDVKNGGVNPEDVDVSPRSILNVEYSEDQRFIVSFDPHSETDPIRITAASMRFSDPIDGKDKFTATSTYDQYYYGALETGEIYLVPEGYKSALKHIILRTYADDQDEMPSIFVKFKSLQDEDWTNVGDKFLQAAITLDGVSCALPDTTPIIGACSSKLGLPGGNVTYNLPWPTDNCRFFHETGGTYTQMTETTNNPPVLNSRTYLKAGMYQVEVNENDGSVYVFCENEPAVTASIGDLIYHDTSDEVSKVKTIDNVRTLVLSFFLNPDYGSTANNASHMYGYEVPAEDGEVKVGMSQLGEGFKLLIGLVPVTDSDGDDEATVAKITGITFGYVPLGRKTLEASGS